MNIIFYQILLTEAIIGGGGRIFAIGPVTLRMLLFLACFLFWFVAAIKRSDADGRHLAFITFYLFLLSLFPGIIVDISTGTSVDQIVTEIVPLLFWTTAPLIALSLSSHSTVIMTAKFIVNLGALISLIALTLMASLFLGLLPFANIYEFATNTGELIFRSEFIFFYKGIFYSSVALVFIVIIRPRFWIVISLFILMAILLTLTRGVMISLFITISLYMIINIRIFQLSLLLLTLSVLSIYFSDAIMDILFYDSGRQMSVVGRSEDLQYVIGQTNLNSFLFGNGPTEPINERPQVENSYVDVFWKFGIFGLTFTLLPALFSFYYFRKIPKNDTNFEIASAFFYGLFFLYVVTATNPFINNSIGAFYALVSMFSIRRLSKASFS